MPHKLYQDAFQHLKGKVVMRDGELYQLRMPREPSSTNPL